MIITLCGSSRFEAWFKVWNEALSLAGHCVFTVSVYPSFKEGNKDWYTEEEKRTLDAVHRMKITRSDVALFLNVWAYMGESTLAEFQYAKIMGTRIVFLESWGKGNGPGSSH